MTESVRDRRFFERHSRNHEFGAAPAIKEGQRETREKGNLSPVRSPVPQRRRAEWRDWNGGGLGA